VAKVGTKGYCSDCGNWATDCKIIVVYSIPEKVCADCRERNESYSQVK
jgi:hypothetical protein